jgi:hypothetical protein
MSLNRIIKDELSGNDAKSYVAQITRFHRIQGSTMFHDAAEYVKNELTKLGLNDAVIEQFPADGKTKYWTYTSPVGWTVKSAELHLVEPEQKLIARYKDIPQCLHTFSNATPKEGVTAELIDVGSGTKPADYQGKNVKGKIVLATGRATPVHKQAVYKRGAAGVITDTITYETPGVRESLDIPDAHAYQGIWPTAEEKDKVTWGFSLSKRQGTELRAFLNKGKTVKLKAKIDAKLFNGKEDVITATIPGKQKPNEEVFLVAHLCHPKPSANDNASGAGLLLEIARTIQTLIETGKIKRPARTIRFFWVPETMGTVAYLSAHEDIRKKLVAGINLDMVGQNQELCKSTLNLDRAPESLPSYLNDYVFHLIEESTKIFDRQTTFGSSSTFRYRTTAFSGGSDHAEFTSPPINVPCIMLLQWPDLYYHTSMDTMDKVSEDTLARVGWIATVAVLTLANADVETAYFLANLTAAEANTRTEKTIHEAVDELFKNKQDPKLKGKRVDLAKQLSKTIQHYRNKLEHLVWREQQAIKSVEKLATNPELKTLIKNLSKDVANNAEKAATKIEQTLNFICKTSSIKTPTKPKETKTEAQLKKLVPKRLFKGTLSSDTLKKALDEKESEWLQELEHKREFDKKAAEMVNFMDGKRNAFEILKAVSAEYSDTDPEHVLRHLKNLEKTKFITFK